MVSVALRSPTGTLWMINMEDFNSGVINFSTFLDEVHPLDPLAIHRLSVY